MQEYTCQEIKQEMDVLQQTFTLSALSIRLYAESWDFPVPALTCT